MTKVKKRLFTSTDNSGGKEHKLSGVSYNLLPENVINFSSGLNEK